MNRVILFGNLGADPELRITPGGSAVLKLRMATTESYKDKHDGWKERTEWHSVTVWGKRAESLAKILRKGSKVLIDGSIRTSNYEKNGEKRYRTEINASDVKLADRKPSGGSTSVADDKGDAWEPPGEEGDVDF